MRLLSSKPRAFWAFRKLLLCLLFFSSFHAFAQTSEVTGVVTDSTGKGVAGATVSVKGIKMNAVTSVDGNFSIRAKAGDVLVVNAIGYSVKETTISGSSVTVSLIAVTTSLNDVVVTGYTRQAKRDVTGAVSIISSDVVAKTPVTDVGSVLQGRAAGVSVDNQGGPGATAVVRIRGFGTNGNNDPLYVVDGVQTRDISNLVNANDIETITILKDPSLTSLYGAQGGNGVIVITTKTGKIGAPKLEYSGYISRESPIKYPSLISPQAYANSYWGYLKNSGLDVSNIYYGDGETPVLPDFIVEKGSTSFPAATGDPSVDPSLYNLSNYRILQTNKQGTDWFREVMQASTSTTHQLSLSGATDKSNYALTFNYLDNTGVLIGTYFKRYSLRVNTEFKPTSWLKIGENMQFAFSQGNNNISNHNPQGLIADLYNRSPLIPVYDIAGNYSGPKGITSSNAFQPGGNNPVYGQRYSKENSNGYSAGLISSAFVDVEPIKGLVFESKVGIQFYPYSYRNFSDTLPQNVYASGINSFSEGNGWSTDWRWTNKVSYDFRIKQIHKISAFVAYEAREYNFRLASGNTFNLPYTIAPFLLLGNGVPIDSLNVRDRTSGNIAKATNLSVFGNINYTLMDKYLLSFVARRDASSKFGPLNRYGNFFSYSAGWRVSREKFMQNINWLNDFKIRAAVGENGNDAIPDGLYVDQYNTSPYVSSYDLSGSNTSAQTGVGLYQIGNPYLHWETNKTTNLGFDATMFQNHFNVAFSWFNRETRDLLAVPPISGLRGDALAPYQNIMKFSNKGIELELGYNNTISKKFRYELNFNISTYRNKVLFIDQDSVPLNGDSYAPTHFYLTRSVVGKPVSMFFGYVQEGIFQSGEEYTKSGVTEFGLTADNAAGHFKFKDINGDGKINDDDRTFLGSPHPKFSYGFNLNLYYGNFDMSLFLQGVQGNKIFNYWRAYSQWPGAQGEGSDDTWSDTNKDASLPIWNATATDDKKPSSFFVEDGSYLRIKSLQLGYTIPASKAFRSLRFYVQGFNLATFTNYSGIDPEISTGNATNAGIDYGGNYPLARKLLFGVNIGL